MGAEGDRLWGFRDNHAPRAGRGGGHQPRPLPGCDGLAERIRRPRAMLAAPRLPDRRVRGRRARRPRLRRALAHTLGRRDDEPRPDRPEPQHRQDPGRHVMKKLINAPEDVVTDALAGMAAAHPSLAVDLDNKIITRAGAPAPGKVGLVSGGGSGHEPLHGGFVGYGMLDAACAGEVFTSPVPDPMLAATTAHNAGVSVLDLVQHATPHVP